MRVDIDVLQPKFQGLHYGVETLDEMRRRKRRRTAAMKKEETKAAQKKKSNKISWCSSETASTGNKPELTYVDKSSRNAN